MAKVRGPTSNRQAAIELAHANPGGIDVNQHLRAVFFGVFVSCCCLNLLGLAVDAAWARPAWALSNGGYFGYRIRALQDFPFCVAGTLLLIALNGAGFIWRGVVRAGLSWGSNGLGGEVSLPHVQIVGLNLIAVPAILAVYVWLSLSLP